MRPLAPRERRIVALGLLAGVLAFVWLAVCAPVIGSFQEHGRQRQDLLARYRANQRLLVAIPILRDAAAGQRRTASLYQITAPTQALALDALQQRLANTLTQAGATVSAVQPIQADVPSGWIGVRADVRITLTQLTASLRRLENEAPYVVVAYASLSADRDRRTGSGPLEVRLQIQAPFHAARAG